MRNRTYKIADVGGTLTITLFGYCGSDNCLAVIDVSLTTIRAFICTANGIIASEDRAGNLIAETDGFGNTVREYF